MKRLGHRPPVRLGSELSHRVRKQQLRYRLALFVERRGQLGDRLGLQLERPPLPFTCRLQPKSDLAGSALSFGALHDVSQPLQLVGGISRASWRSERRAVPAEGMTVVVNCDVPTWPEGLIPSAASEPSRAEPVQDGRRTYAKSRCRCDSRDLAAHPPRLLA